MGSQSVEAASPNESITIPDKGGIPFFKVRMLKQPISLV